MVMDTRDINYICLNCFANLDRNFRCKNCGMKEGELFNVGLALPVRTLLERRYLMSRTLGFGGFGITYLAWDLHTSEPVAIKEFMPKGYAKRDNGSLNVKVNDSFSATFNHWLTAFIKEAQILTSIRKTSGVVKMKDFFLSHNTAYIVMDYLEGTSLRKYVNMHGGKVSYEHAIKIFSPLMEALHYLHRHGIIHNDISPENIMIVKNKYIKLIDFGAASLFAQKIDKPFIVLKKGYSPIELYYSNLPRGPWTDIYQVAATLYNIITGDIPPEAPSRRKLDLMKKPSYYGIKVPPYSESSIMTALNVSPYERYNNVEDFANCLGIFNINFSTPKSDEDDYDGDIS